MKSKISKALQDPCLQHGFELICKELTELKRDKQSLRADLRTAKNNLQAKDTVYRLAMEENAKLKEKLESAEKTRDYWKGSSFDWRHKCVSRKPFRAAVKAQKQLEKAKELIENIIRVTWGEGWNYSLDWKVKAEQFINEVEK